MVGVRGASSRGNQKGEETWVKAVTMTAVWTPACMGARECAKEHPAPSLTWHGVKGWILGKSLEWG